MVSGEAIERAAAMTYWEHRESIRRFQRLMENIGVEEALREAGIEEGDTVIVGDYAWNGRIRSAIQAPWYFWRHI